MGIDELEKSVKENFKQFEDIAQQLIKHIEKRDETINEYKQFLKNDMLQLVKDELEKNPEFKTKFDKLTK